MKLKLKEEPREWLKFTAVMAVMAGVVGFVLHRRKIIGVETLAGIGIAMVLAVIAWRTAARTSAWSSTSITRRCAERGACVTRGLSIVGPSTVTTIVEVAVTSGLLIVAAPPSASATVVVYVSAKRGSATVPAAVFLTAPPAISRAVPLDELLLPELGQQARHGLTRGPYHLRDFFVSQRKLHLVTVFGVSVGVQPLDEQPRQPRARRFR